MGCDIDSADCAGQPACVFDVNLLTVTKQLRTSGAGAYLAGWKFAKMIIGILEVLSEAEKRAGVRVPWIMRICGEFPTTYEHPRR